jgi:hypothetical protein
MRRKKAISQGVDDRLDDLDHLVGGARLADCLGLHVFAHN